MSKLTKEIKDFNTMDCFSDTFFFSSRRRHTRCALVTGVQTCALPISGIVFIGPTPDNIRTFGLKHSARALAAAHGVPLAPGTDLLTGEEEAVAAPRETGFPVILKATAGGGGIGMSSEEHTSELQSLMRSSYAVLCLTKKT